MSTSALAHTSSRALVTALIAGVVFLGGAGAADAKDSQARTGKTRSSSSIRRLRSAPRRNRQEASAKAEVDSPVQTKAADPDSASDLQELAEHVRRPLDEAAVAALGIQRVPPDHGSGGKILLIAGSGNNSDVFEAGTFKSYIWEPETGALAELKTFPTDMFCAGPHADEQW